MSQSQLTYYQNFKIYFTFLLLWFSVQFEQVVEDTLAYSLVITIGIFHGANDLLVLSKSQSERDSFVKNLLIYLLIIVVCVLVYLVYPLLAILLFVIISAYHFGEEHFSSAIKRNFIFDTIYYLFYGLFIFVSIFYNSLDEVNVIMQQLANYQFSKYFINVGLSLSGLCLLLMSAFLLIKKEFKIVDAIKEVFFLLLLFLVFKSTSLILGFAIYFIFWHSLPSIIHQVNYLSGNLNKNSLLSYVKSAAIYWVISVFGMVTLYFLIPDITQLATVIFVILFAVTAPHIWVMFSMKN